MELNRAQQMVIFYYLVKAGSFTGAGKLMGVSTSYISKQINELENSLRTKLVQRSTRVFSVTEQGERFFLHCEQIVEKISEAESQLEDQHEKVEGVLRLGVAQSFGSLHIIPAIEKLRQRYPKLEIQLSLFDHTADMIQQNLDLWITNYETLPQGYVAQRMAECHFVVVASPDYLINHQAPVVPSDLVKHNCLVYQSKTRDYSHWAFKNDTQDLKVRVEGNYRVDLAEAIRDAAIAGWGIAYLASYLLKDELQTGKLIRLFPDWEANQHMPFYFVYPSRTNLPSKTKATIAFIKEFIGSPPYWDKGLGF